MKTRCGKVVDEPAEVVEELAKHWEELGKCTYWDNDQQVGQRELGGEGNGDMCEKVTWQEVLGLLRYLQRGKAPGPDGILNEMIVYGGFRLIESLTQLLNIALDEECVPSDWRKSYVVPLFKSGDTEVASNYRGIALGSCVAKVFTRCLTRRLGEFAEERILTEAQGGFRGKRSCADQILVLRGVCELRRRRRKGTYLAFLDVSKAYDTVWREGLWEKMRRYGVTQKFVRVCQGLYEEVEASVVLDGEQSRWFKVEKGLRQGCPLSPLLYSIYVMGMVEELEDSGLGVKEEEEWCGALLYADDIVLLAESPDELQRMLDTVGEYAEEWRFTFNAVKSKTMVVGTSSGGSSWRINGQEMEEVKVFKYLGLWFDRGMRGNVQVEKMAEKAEEWAGKMEWMSRKDGKIEVERGRLVWELLARPGLEHAAEVWWPGGKTVNRKLEAVQERIGRRLLGASRTVAGAAVRGDLGWRKLEERREERKLLYGKRLENLEDSRLVKVVAEKLKNTGGVGWWEEYELLQRRYGLAEDWESESRREVKSKIEEVHAENWCEEVEGKCSLRWYRTAKEELEAERYIDSSLGQEAVRCRFRLRTGSAGLFEDKKRCRMTEDERCILCGSGEVEDVEHFLVRCNEFQGEREELLERVGEVEGADAWVEAFCRAGDEQRTAMMLGKQVEGLDAVVVERVDNLVMGEILNWWKKRKELAFG